MPWLGLHPPESDAPLGTPPEVAAEWFFRRLVGDAAWERMGEEARRDRRADGPALLADLTGIPPGCAVRSGRHHRPDVIGHGGAASFAHHVETARWLAATYPGPACR